MSRRPPDPDPLVGLSDRAQHAAALESRAHHAGRRLLAAETATFVGALRDLAERELPVTIQTAPTRRHRGTLLSVAVDHLVLRRVDGSLVLVALETVVLVRPMPGRGGPAATGDRGPSQDRTLLEALARLAEADREVVAVVGDVDGPLRGEVIGLGEDVVTLRLSGRDRATVYVPMTAVQELIVVG